MYMVLFFPRACRCVEFPSGETTAALEDIHERASIPPGHVDPRLIRGPPGLRPRLGDRAQFSLFPLCVRRRVAAGCARSLYRPNGCGPDARATRKAHERREFLD